MMTISKKILSGIGTLGVAALTAMPAWAQDAATAAPVPDKGDTAWMMVSTILVLMMVLPGLALFYGGLTRTKNMLSTMTQVGAMAALALLVWVTWCRSEEHTSELQSLMRISYAVFCLKKKNARQIPRYT